jgi:predicted dehydrogenase
MNNKIDVAVLGLGAMGGTHVEAAKESPYVDKIYGYEPETERAEARGKELGIIASSNLESILENPEIKLVYIAAINSVHAELTQKALRAGKAVLCEKPMAENILDAYKMIEVQKETDQFLQIGFELHYSKLYMKTKEWIDQGLIGTPLNCHCRYYCSEFHKKNNWRSKSKGHFLIGEKLSHYLDLQRWFMNDDIEEVFSMNSPNVVNYFNHPDNHQINLQFKNGGVANLNFLMYLGETNHEDPLLEMLEKQSDDGHFLQYHIMGTKGAIESDVFRRRLRRWEFRDGPEQLISEIVETIKYTPAEDIEWIHNTHGQNLRIAELVAKGMKPEVSAAEAYKTMQLCFAAEMSEKQKRIVKVSELDNLSKTHMVKTSVELKV